MGINIEETYHRLKSNLGMESEDHMNTFFEDISGIKEEIGDFMRLKSKIPVEKIPLKEDLKKLKTLTEARKFNSKKLSLDSF